MTTGLSFAASCILFSGCAFRSRCVGCSMYWMRSKAARDFCLDLLQEVEHVLDVRALLVEVERVVPLRAAALGLRLRRDLLDRQDAVDVPRQVVAVELDLQVRQAVRRRSTRPAFPAGRRLIGFATSPAVSGSSAPTRWYSGIRGFGSRSVYWSRYSPSNWSSRYSPGRGS